jgi:hypothetical protein
MPYGRVIEHEIKCIGNSDRTFHSEAGAPFGQVADRTIDRGPVTFEDDVRSLENAVTSCLPSLLRRLFHRWILQPNG